ncbi:MAG: phosphoglycerate dehydrogenase [Deltaproteobacteria bacterium]|nr:phosphoglycerate dehydrogenase [Deltaproteobacteria bacterium]
MKNKKIFVAMSTFGEYGQAPLKLLQESGFSYSLNPLKRRPNPKEIVEMAKDCEGIIAGVELYDAKVLDQLPKLQCLSRCGVGIDNIDLEKAKAKKIAVLNTPDVVVQPVAELTLAMIFDLLRNVTAQTLRMKAKKWEKQAGSLLGGKKIGILGLGRIGKRIAELLRKLDAEVLGADLYPDKAWAATQGVTLLSIEELIETSDILSIHLSVLKDNPFQLGKKEFLSMKKGAMLINVSRGSLIDEDALYEALKSGHLSGAALDVFQEEPYVGELTGLDNVILTPHIATLTEQSRLQMETEAVQNLIRYFQE